MLKIVQVGLVTSDLPGTLRLYSEGLGFKNAGATCLWGEMSEKITKVRGDSRNVIWWMVGPRKFFQLEIFHYTCPVPQPIPSDWRPSDQGWPRMGVRVVDFDASLAGLKRSGVEPITQPTVKAGLRSAAIRDPYIGAIVEVMESDPKASEGPVVAYVTNSVADIEEARTFYRDVLKFEILPLEHLHTPEDEALWGLAGAEREGFVARVCDTPIEVVQYLNPAGRPKPINYQVCDQGIMNIAIAAKEVQPVVDLLDRIEASGVIPPHIYNDGYVVAAYTLQPDRILEYGTVPEDLQSFYGFEAAPFDFLGGSIALREQD